MMSESTPDPPPFVPPELAGIPAKRRREMLRAGREALECRRVLRRGGLNLVGEVLRGEKPFVELEHYPENDVYDPRSGAQYYYHAHRGEVEHGHFHTFLRAAGMPAAARPLEYPLTSEPWPQGDGAICHLTAISMDGWGDPIGLFSTNRWVTNETFYPAEQAIEMLRRFDIDHAAPSWPLNRWIGAMLVLYGPEIEALLHHRDAALWAWQKTHPGLDVFEDRRLDLLAFVALDVEARVAELAASLA